MVFLSPGLKGIVLEIIQPTKCPNCVALKLFFFFFLLLKTAKIKQQNSYCLKVLICVEDSGILWLFELEFHMSPNTESI